MKWDPEKGESSAVGWPGLGRRDICIVVLLVLVVTFVAGVSGAYENFCRDPESWKEWDTLLEKYPGDMDVHALHALRIGLCFKVDRGDLSVQEATEIFERARDAVVRKRKAGGGEKGKLGL